MNALAYVFWHWPRAEVPRDDYVARQAAFQEALRAAPPAGFRGSVVLAVAGLPWVAGGGAAYEDWYRVDGSAALDPLNEAAVTASRTAAHERAAAAAAGGTAGLYRLRAGAAPQAPRHAWWFAKPDGMRYVELFGLLAAVTQDGRAALWLRQMVLGPGPECCLQSAEAVVLPSPLSPLHISLRPVWPPE